MAKSFLIGFIVIVSISWFWFIFTSEKSIIREVQSSEKQFKDYLEKNDNLAIQRWACIQDIEILKEKYSRNDNH